ncbi:hypothetical protein AB0J20_07365 [Micromonospora costi]|uniref:hypothetical protein n=1 Tax=Micromonospora costi TaxID=1530042 RepID=UPI0033F00C52
MSVHLFLSAGRGPRECAWALARLLRRLEAEAARRGLATSRVETVAGDQPGTHRSVLLRITGARQRIEDGDEAARRALATSRWRVHDELVRGDPVRVERPSR